MPARLPHAYDSAFASYKQNWQVVDEELYDLCLRRGHAQFLDVFAKVAVINRVYLAGLVRTLGRTAETDVAGVMLANAALITRLLSVPTSRPLDGTVAAEIVDIHGQLTNRIALGARGTRWAVSFVSKYMHFHHPLVPIYDANVVKSIRQWVTRSELQSARQAVAKPSGIHSNAYYEYVSRFLALFQRVVASRPSSGVTVKGVDVILW